MRVKYLLPLSLLAIAACSNQDDPAGPNPGLPSLGSGRPGSGPGAVYVASNDAAGNAILRFSRGVDGQLESPVAYPTGGLGSGAGLGNQGGLALAHEGRFLYAINAGSDEISGFREDGAGIALLGTWPSGGELPVSIAVHGRLLYVLHNGATATLQGFSITEDGSLAPIPGSGRVLDQAAAVGAAEASITPDGSRLVVSEKATNLLVTFAINPDGTLSGPVTTASAGMTPFGFGFNRAGLLFVSEAFGGSPGASSVSSYGLDDLTWDPISPSAATTETAACWLVVSPTGRFAYTPHTGSASVSGFAIGSDGSLGLLNPDGVTGNTGATPIDLGITGSGRYLYTLNSGSHSISAFRAAEDGSLTGIGEFPALPVAANGLVVR